MSMAVTVAVMVRCFAAVAAGLPVADGVIPFAQVLMSASPGSFLRTVIVS